MTYICKMDSSMGTIFVASDGEDVTGLWLEGQKYFKSGLKEYKECGVHDFAVFCRAKEWLDCYFDGREPDFLLPLSPAGSEFRKAVWKILLETPYGTLTTYGAIAKKIREAEGGQKAVSAQAVGGAVGHNPISILIPCHRVVGTNGSLTGYAGGLDKKIKLLELEGADLSGLFVPHKGTAL